MTIEQNSRPSASNEDPALLASQELDRLEALPTPDDDAVDAKTDLIDRAMKLLAKAVPTTIAGIREALRWAQDEECDEYDSAEIIRSVMASPLLN